MNNTVLQIPINKTLRNNMTKMAVNMGFSSLQELTRVIFTQLEKSNLRLSLEPKAIKLSPAAIKRYDKMSSDIETGKVKLKTATSVDDLMKQLNN